MIAFAPKENGNYPGNFHISDQVCNQKENRNYPGNFHLSLTKPQQNIEATSTPRPGCTTTLHSCQFPTTTRQPLDMHLKAATTTISSKNSAAILSKNSAAILSIVGQRKHDDGMYTGKEKQDQTRTQPTQTIGLPRARHQNKQTKRTTTPIDVRTSNQKFEATSARSSSCLKTSKGVSEKWSSSATARKRITRDPSHLAESPSTSTESAVSSVPGNISMS